MLRRQRTILRILRTANGKVRITQLQKFAFLLRHETFIGNDNTFYEFFPYRFGPFSFAAKREIECLASYGYLNLTGRSLSITALGEKEADRVDSDTARAVLAVFSKHGEKTLPALLKDVYRDYPWYASKSRLTRLIPSNTPKSNLARLAIYTIGYENHSIDGFFNTLLYTGIRGIIDVRANPVSRKYGFASRSLAWLASKLGLTYDHCGQLGISSEKRKEARTSSEFLDLFRYYERQILPKSTDALTKTARLVKRTPSVLVCKEKEADKCHRSRLAAKIAAMTDLDVVHL